MRATAQRLEFIQDYLTSLFGSDLHAKRVCSLSHAVLGVMTSASLAVALIGQALAQARGKSAKHAIKQVDRLLSNQGVDPWELSPLWIKETIGASRDIVIAMDWTDFDADDQSTLALNLVTKHGRAQPLLWLSVFKSELAGKRNDTEDSCLVRLKQALPEGTKVTILADRGFGDVKLFGFLAKLGFGYVIRFRGDTYVTAADGETRRTSAQPPDCDPGGGDLAGQAKSRRGRLRPRQGHEGRLASGRERRRGDGARDHQLILSSLEHRARI
jgi:hypothetical protein